MDALNYVDEKPGHDNDGVEQPDIEELREQARQNNPSGTANLSSGVSVHQAEADFAELARELSRASRAQSHTNHPHKPGHGHGDDEEKAGGESGVGIAPSSLSEEGSGSDRFDLEDTLRGGLDAEREAGIRPKHVGVYWDGLTVKGIGGVENFVKTFPDAFVDSLDFITPLRRWLGLGKKAGVENTLLDNFRGVCKPGEMILVLGKPGSGCTTFLKNIANQRHGYTSVTGEVQYGPFSAQEFKKFRGESVYNQEGDVHHETLTVEQTLGFALDVKIPGKRPAGISKTEFKEQVITTLLKMFNIEHTRNTVVGGLFVRGISGGERKRVSIAEMLITNACVLAWDNSTRGLDGSTALDFVKSLRIQTNLYKTSTFVSLYQASENIYRQFDKVLVIDGGKQVYFGPAADARSYFEGLGFLPRPRQTTPDYVTGCTDEFERMYQEGRSPKNAPHDPTTLEAAFNASRYAEALTAEMAEYKNNLPAESHKYEDFRIAVREQKRRGTPKKSVYSTGFHHQVWALMKRQFILTMQDRFTLTLCWARAVVIALVLGSLYYNLPQTSTSAFSKGGLIFISILFNAFEAFSELASTMGGRAIVNKHKAYAFHRPSALWIAQIFVDQAFSASRIMVFSLIVYFMTNLYRSAGAFFTFYLVVLSGNIGMTLFFRITGCISPDYDYALKLAAVILTLFVATTGYIIQWQSEQVWLRWIFYINILGLAFSAMMDNEFSRLEMECIGTSLIPNGGNYTNLENQVCTLAGSRAGRTTVSGTQYLVDGFAYNAGDLWRNWGIIVVLIAFFLIMNVVLGEIIKFGMGGNTAKVFQRPNAERKKLNEALRQKREQRLEANSTSEDTSELRIKSESVLTWENLCYEVPVAGGTRRLLNNIYGYVKPGELTALMGASGAGKTTLLDVLAARKNIGVITGDIFVDGVKPGKEFQRSTSYAEQLDMHDPSATVREALRFSADLRQPYETPREEKYAYVEEIIALLEMETFADAIIGTPEDGLTVEQRKRVTIGVELAARPQLLLFLDEPTSGLDSQSAFNIVRFLKKLSRAGQAILCTIHQPNAVLFENFDRLLLLKSGGRCVYFGDIGEDASILRDYLKQHGAEAQETENVAEFMLGAIGAGSSPRVGDRDWADIWDSSPEFAHVKNEISRIKAVRQEAGANVDHSLEREYASPLLHQLKVVINRMNLSYWRMPNYLFTRLFNHIVIAIIIGFAFFQLDNSKSSLQYTVFVIFYVTVLPALIITQAEVMYHVKRTIFFREQSSKMYSALTFATAMVVAELPYGVLCTVGFFLPLYYLPGLPMTSWQAGYMFFMTLITELFSVTMGQGLAALTPSLYISTQFDPWIMTTFVLFCGVTIPAPQMTYFWRAWMYQLNPFTRLVGGMVVTVLHGLPVVCSSAELNEFSAPAGMTCGEYMQPFFDAGGAGYIVNNATSDCQYCAYSLGDQFYESLDLSFDNRWRDLGIYAAFIGSNLIVLFFASRYLNYNKR